MTSCNEMSDSESSSSNANNTGQIEQKPLPRRDKKARFHSQGNLYSKNGIFVRLKAYNDKGRFFIDRC